MRLMRVSCFAAVVFCVAGCPCWAGPSTVPGNDGGGPVLASGEVPAPVPYAIHPGECTNPDRCQCKNNFASQSGHCHHRVCFYEYREIIHLMEDYEVGDKGDVEGYSYIVWSMWMLSARSGWAYRFGGASSPVDIDWRKLPGEEDALSFEWYEGRVEALALEMIGRSAGGYHEHELEIEDRSVFQSLDLLDFNTDRFTLVGHFNSAQLARDMVKRLLAQQSDVDLVKFPGGATAGRATCGSFYEGTILPGAAGDPVQHDRACGLQSAERFDGEWHLVDEMGITYSTSESFSKGFSIGASAGQSGGKGTWSLSGSLSFTWTTSRSQASNWNWVVRRNELSAPIDCCWHVPTVKLEIYERNQEPLGQGDDASEPDRLPGEEGGYGIPPGQPHRLVQLPREALPEFLHTASTYCVGPQQTLRVPPTSPLHPTLKTFADNPQTPCASVGGMTAFATFLVQAQNAEEPGVPTHDVTEQIREVPSENVTRPRVTENPDGSFEIDLNGAAMLFDLGSRLMELVTSSGGSGSAAGEAGAAGPAGAFAHPAPRTSSATTLDFADPGAIATIPTSLNREQVLQTNVYVPLDSEQLRQAVEQTEDIGLVFHDLGSRTMTAAAAADVFVVGQDGRLEGAYFNCAGLPVGSRQAEAILVDRKTDLVLATRPLGAPASTDPGVEACEPRAPFTGGTLKAMTDKPDYEAGEMVTARIVFPEGWNQLPGYEAGGCLTIRWSEQGQLDTFAAPGMSEQQVSFAAGREGVHQVRADLKPLNRASAARLANSGLIEQAREAVDSMLAEKARELEQLELMRATEAGLIGLPGGMAMPREALDWMQRRVGQERDGLEVIHQQLGR